MDEIEYKLKKKNAILIVNAISKLIDTIQKKGTPQSGKMEELPELVLLKEKCKDPDPIISIAACQGVVTLVEIGVLGVIPTLSSFVAALPTFKTYTGVVPSIGSLLIIDIKARHCEGKAYECPFNLKAPQHPLITVLKQNKTIWYDVIKLMQFFCSNKETIVVNNCLELLQPVFLYALCDPSMPPQLPITCRQQICRLLFKTSFDLKSQDILLNILSWIQIESDAELLIASDIYAELVQFTLQYEELSFSAALTPFIAALVHRLISHGHDPRSGLSTLSHLLELSPEAGSCVLMILTKSIDSCPVIYLKDLISFCIALLEKKLCNTITAHMLVCAVLQWLIYPSYLTGDALQEANYIVSMAKDNDHWLSNTGKLCGNKIFTYLRNSDSLVGMSVELCKLSETWQSNPDIVLNWLKRATKMTKELNEHLQLFVSALFISNIKETEVKFEIFKLIMNIVECNNKLATPILSLILYKMTEEKEPALQLEYIRGLTNMAIKKENVNMILHILESFKNRESIKPLLVDLYVRLWKVESRSYPYLQKLLSESPIEGKNWRFDLARAQAIKEICDTGPTQHGSELVKFLSQILNNCGSEEGGIISAIAVQGITALCKTEIVNIVTTWRALAPKLSRDKRPLVIKSLCNFFGYALSLECSNQEHNKLIADIICKLWIYISKNENDEIVTAALHALSKADIEKLSLKTLPESYRQRLQLPSSYAKTPVDAARKPEDVLPYIPCECWIQLLEKMKSENLNAAGDMLKEWLSVELTLYLNNIYRTSDSRGEPPNYSYLPEGSVCRGIAEYLRKLSQAKLEASNIPVARECLRILGHKLPRPLPPFNWTFLQKYVEEPDLLSFSIIVAAKQAVASPSARRVVENYMSNFQPSVENEDIIRKLFEILPDLCNGVPPNSLNPFVGKSLKMSIDITEQDDKNQLLLKDLLSHIKMTLKRDDIHDANRAMLSLLIEGFLEKFDSDNIFFDAYVDCVTEMTSKHLERMSSPSNWWEVTTEKLRQSLGIRCALACKADTNIPLVWLNEIIDASLFLVGEHTKVLQNIVSVLSCIRYHSSNCLWTMELLGQIEILVNKKSESDKEQAVVFLCDIFLVTVIMLSGCDCLVSNIESITSSRDTRLQLFPIALNALLMKEQWKTSVSQIMEWLYHMRSFSAVSPLYKDTFQRGLIALRHNKYFKTSSVWIRFISCKA